MSSKPYNGHRSEAFWNVALWIRNDEGLYNLVKDCIRRSPNRDAAARLVLESLKECGVTHTPDGYAYSKSAIREAMVGL